MDVKKEKILKVGGLVTDESTVDPVSGNEVPPGSNAEDVRDDVDAKLSPNEYVVPADVLRYFGVSFFEKLRAKAKAGLEEMNSDGRIGGGNPQAEAGDELPFSVDELQSEDMPDETQNFATGGLTDKQEEQQFLNAQPTFNPNQYGFGGDTYSPQPYQAPVNYATQPSTTTPVTATPTTSTNKQGRAGVDYGTSSTKTSAQGSQSEGAITAGNWAKDLNFSDPQSIMDWADKKATGNSAQRIGASLVGGVVAGPLGAGIGAAASRGQNIAEIRAAARLAGDAGNEALQKELEDKANARIADMPFGGIIDHFATGDRLYAAAVRQRNAAAATTTGATRTGSDGSGTMTNRGVTSRTQGTGSDGSWSSAATRGSTAPTSSPVPQARPTTSSSSSSRPATQSYSNNTTGANATRRAKGGLITKPKKKS